MKHFIDRLFFDLAIGKKYFRYLQVFIGSGVGIMCLRVKPAARSVAAATDDAADMPRFVGSLSVLCTSLLPKGEQPIFS